MGREKRRNQEPNSITGTLMSFYAPDTFDAHDTHDVHDAVSLYTLFCPVTSLTPTIYMMLFLMSYDALLRPVIMSRTPITHMMPFLTLPCYVTDANDAHEALSYDAF